jgi:hypothetical protein
MLSEDKLEQSEEPAVAHAAEPPELKRDEQPLPLQVPYKPYEKAGAPEAPYEPYAKKSEAEVPYIPYEKPAVPEAPYKPYAKKPGAETPYKPYEGM